MVLLSPADGTPFAINSLSRYGCIVHRSFHADLLEQVQGCRTTGAHQKAKHKRQVWVDPLFTEAKDWHSLRRLRLQAC